MKLFWTSRRSRERKALRASVRGRAPVSDRKFVYKAGGGGDLARQVARVLRSLAGNTFRVPADRIYPEDTFQELFDESRWIDWDILELILALEDELNIAIKCDEDLEYEYDEKLDDLTDLRTITVGEWVCRMAKLLQERLDHGEA